MEQLLEFTNNNLLLTGGLVASLFLVIATEMRLATRGKTDLDTATAIGLINADASVIDIRPAESFNAGHIAGSRNVTADSLSSNEDRLADLKDKKIIITCASGMQCSRVVNTLRKKGYDNVYALRGGLASWQQDKLPLVSATKSKNKKKKKNKDKKADA
ncbi:MAG: rhodanese-like domain-containing protein [Pseudomonadota bacterium]